MPPRLSCEHRGQVDLSLFQFPERNSDVILLVSIGLAPMGPATAKRRPQGDGSELSFRLAGGKLRLLRPRENGIQSVVNGIQNWCVPHANTPISCVVPAQTPVVLPPNKCLWTKKYLNTSNVLEAPKSCSKYTTFLQHTFNKVVLKNRLVFQSF